MGIRSEERGPRLGAREVVYSLTSRLSTSLSVISRTQARERVSRTLSRVRSHTLQCGVDQAAHTQTQVPPRERTRTLEKRCNFCEGLYCTTKPMRAPVRAPMTAQTMMVVQSVTVGSGTTRTLYCPGRG